MQELYGAMSETIIDIVQKISSHCCDCCLSLEETTFKHHRCNEIKAKEDMNDFDSEVRLSGEFTLQHFQLKTFYAF